MLECLTAVNACGLYQTQPESNMIETPHSQDEHVENCKEEIMASSTSLENVWQSAYEKRRDSWKKNMTISMNEPQNVNGGSVLEPDIISYETALENQIRQTVDTPMTPSIQQHIDVLDPERDVDINKVIMDWNLNDNQACAFKIIS